MSVLLPHDSWSPCWDLVQLLALLRWCVGAGQLLVTGLSPVGAVPPHEARLTASL